MIFTACTHDNDSGTTTAQETAISKISSFAQDGGIAPNIQDYIDAGVSGITADNLDAINAVVLGLTAEDVDTSGEIQTLTNELSVEITENIPPIAKAGSPKTTVEEGETVYFSSRKSSDVDGEIVKFQWFENGVSIAKVSSLWKVYNVAGTYNIKLVVTDNDGASSSVGYTITVKAPPAIAVVSSGPTNDTYFENTTVTPLPTSTKTKINIDATNTVSSITKVTVSIDLTHTKDKKLKIWIKSPSGTKILLSSKNGGTGDNYTNTTFDDDAATSITAGSAPFTGTFIPEESLATFVGEDPNGTWQLSIKNNAGSIVGTLNSWSITVE